ncbi:DinB family protein [Paenibacillus sp. GCM10023250]|uniref:DinB family protein n=1 Tax=Paenibacillus sp. GCM10023250 TaxID=3252648 RepID=UPI0036229BD2
MRKLFEYNWQVRDDWFDWCETVDEQELLKRRTGGPGSILYTLFHIAECEYAWISGLQGKPDQGEPPFEEYASLQKVRAFSEQCRAMVEPFVREWNSGMEHLVLTGEGPPGQRESFAYGEVMRHVIAHEIHHIGQLSVWSRELGKQPVTANLIRRGLYKTEAAN